MISPKLGPKRGWLLGMLFGALFAGSVAALEGHASGPVLFFLGMMLGMITTVSFDLLLTLSDPPEKGEL